MSRAVTNINSYIESLEDLDSAAAHSTACLHYPDSCRLQRDTVLARPALRVAIAILKAKKIKLLKHENSKT